MKRRRITVGRAARERRMRGGARAIGRDAASVAEYAETKRRLAERSGGVCEVCTAKPARDPDHIIARAKGGSDLIVNLVHACRACHDKRAAPFTRGRLLYGRVYSLLPHSRLGFAVAWYVVEAESKQAWHRGDGRITNAGSITLSQRPSESEAS